MYFKTVSLVALALGLSMTAMTVPALAHHSFAATYSVDQTMVIEGTVVRFEFRNPHAFLHVMTIDKDGEMVTWAVEWGSADTLGGINIKPSTVKPGDKVKVTGSPARNIASHRLRMRSIERPSDGWKWGGTFG